VRLPRGAIQAAQLAIVRAATDFGHGNLVAGDSEDFARAAIEAVLSVIERDARRKVARELLARFSARLPEQEAYGAYMDMRTDLRRLARGEELAVIEAAPEGATP
jgi:hypothetical protein